MFLGGADHEAERIRESSIKGALAFWWRALNYARFVGEADGADESAKLNNALAAMQKEEQKLFGGPDGQGVFLLRVHTATLNKLDKANILSTDGQAIKPTNGANPVGVGARYLGYGILEAFSSQKRGTFAGQLVRNCFAAGQTFSIEIIFRPTDDTKDIKEVIDALKLFGLLGGLGSRVRRGWGSVALVKLEGENLPEDMNVNWQEPESRKDYIARLKELFKDHPSLKQSGRDWPLTAFAKETVIRVGNNTNPNSLSVLNSLGKGFQLYRAGLDKNTRKFLGTATEGAIKRRASPLLFHISKIGSQFQAVVICMPTKFHLSIEVSEEHETIPEEFFGHQDFPSKKMFPPEDAP